MIDYLASPPLPHTPASEFYDMVRILVLMVSLYCFVQIAMLYQWWSRLPVYLRLMLLSNLIFVVVSGYGVLEAYIRDVPGGPRSLGFLVGVVYCAAGLTLGVRAVGSNPTKKE